MMMLTYGGHIGHASSVIYINIGDSLCPQTTDSMYNTDDQQLQIFFSTCKESPSISLPWKMIICKDFSASTGLLLTVLLRS